ncbi:MAG: hypothetical protein SCK28_05765 [Bacillota bacterium]|nr:hypothetical protein [Bacillota bacterium]
MLFFKLPIRDKIALSVFSGFLGTLVMYLVGIPLYFLNISKLIYLIYAIELFVTPEIARTTAGQISGGLVGLLVGGGLAFGFKLIIEWTGFDWIWIKALGYGAMIWFFWVGITRNFLNVTMYIFDDLATNMILLGQSELYIIATTYFMIKLAGSKEALQFGDRNRLKLR